MTTKATLKPGQKGTKRLTDKSGERLVCVLIVRKVFAQIQLVNPHRSYSTVQELIERLIRSKYDVAAGRRFTTVELIEEESDLSNEPPVSTETEHFAPSQHLAVRVDYWESELREKVKSAGGIWRPRHKLWEMRYDDIVALGLESRVVAGDEMPS
jgi:hypothetical protein